MQSYSDQPCSRCGSPKKVSKTWKEQVPTFSGVTTVDCFQIICTNKACQEAFDKNLLEDNKKREAARVKKEINEKERKENAMLHALQSRKSK